MTWLTGPLLPVSGVRIIKGVIRSRLAATMTFEVLVRNDRYLVRVSTLLYPHIWSCFWHLFPVILVDLMAFLLAFL
jgi:hypothetical protein